jgi:hypothetical protein
VFVEDGGISRRIEAHGRVIASAAVLGNSAAFARGARTQEATAARTSGTFVASFS